MADQVNKKNQKSFKALWESFTIRMKLLWIWLLKNASVLLKTALIIVVVLILVNVIDGSDFLALVGVDKSEIEAVDWNNVKSVENILASLLSALFSVLIIVKKTKSLAIEDIKSRELKIALIKARLYFNENGKLCKKLEETTKVDIDGDGKIGDVEINAVKEENLITGLPRAIGELATIVTAKIETEEEKATVVEGSQLNEDIAVPDTTIEEKLYTEEVGAPEVAETTFDEKLAEVTTEEEKEETAKKSKKKNKKAKTKKKSFIAELFRALRLSLKNPELNDGMDEDITNKLVVKKHEKHIKKDNIEIIEDNEPIQEEEAIITTTIKEDVNNVINSSSDHTENEQVVTTPTTEPVTEVKTAKAKQIDDILNSI